MATNSKTSDPTKDTQVKPIVQSKEPENELTVDPLQNSRLYQTENKALLET